MSGIRQSEGLKVLEFFGVPGVGKSYLVRTAVSDDIARPMEWYNQGSRALRIWRKTGLLLRHFRTAMATASWARQLIYHFQPMSSGRRWKVLFNWAFVDSVIRDAARDRSGFVVFDQGIAQALWSTQFGAGRECPGKEVRTLIRQFLDRLPVAEWGVVHVTAPQEIVRKRVNGREGSSPVDRDLELMDEAQFAGLKVANVLNALGQVTAGALKITIFDFVNDDQGAVTRCRELIGRF